MSDSLSPNWKPSPELLAAYADGELDDREGGADDADDAAELRMRIARWLARNPKAQADLDANRRLKTLWDKTSPAEPSRETWRDASKRLVDTPLTLPSRRPFSAAWLTAGVAAAACLMWAVFIANQSPKTPPAVPEVFAVATNDDVEIQHVEGDAVECVVVGLLPLDGVLNLADPGEVIITSITPARRDNMMPVVHQEAQQRPMIWARRDGEGE